MTNYEFLSNYDQTRQGEDGILDNSTSTMKAADSMDSGHLNTSIASNFPTSFSTDSMMSVLSECLVNIIIYLQQHNGKRSNGQIRGRGDVWVSLNHVRKWRGERKCANPKPDPPDPLPPPIAKGFYLLTFYPLNMLPSPNKQFSSTHLHNKSFDLN